ncbi:MAG: hypothetical protein AB1492_01405 [Bacillota bacterium]
MRDFTRPVLETARERGATYADVREVRNSNERLVVKNGVGSSRRSPGKLAVRPPAGDPRRDAPNRSGVCDPGQAGPR